MRDTRRWIRKARTLLCAVLVLAPLASVSTGAATYPPPSRKPNAAYPLDLDIISEKVARYPNNPYLLNELGNQLLHHGRRDEAAARYTEAVKLNPDFAVAWNNLGVARASLGYNSSTEEAYRKALAINPSYALAWYNLGVILDRQNHYDKAIEAYRKAFVLDPTLLDVNKNPQVVSNRRIAAIAAQAYMEKGNTVVFPVESAYGEKQSTPGLTGAKLPAPPRQP